MRAFEVRTTFLLRVEVHDENVIDRAVNNEDGWQDHLYPLDTAEKVVEMLAYNYLRNGVEDIRRLDGWADVTTENPVLFLNEYHDLDTTEADR